MIKTELMSTPLTVLTVQVLTRGLPTVAFRMGPDGDMVTVISGTIRKKIKRTHYMQIKDMYAYAKLTHYNAGI